MKPLVLVMTMVPLAAAAIYFAVVTPEKPPPPKPALVAPPRPVRIVYPDFQTACRMREEAAVLADWGTPSAQLDMAVFTNDSRELARLFENDRGAIMCQGVAYYLHLKYLEANYRSYLIGFKSEVLSHAIVLVEVRREDGSRALVVQDPSFNLSYVDPKGRPLCILEILDALRQGEQGAVKMLRGKPPVIDYLWHHADPDPMKPIDPTAPMPRRTFEANLGPSKTNPSVTKLRSTLSIDTYASIHADPVREFCARRGVASDIVYAIFDEPIYAYRRYPMNDEDLADADAMFKLLLERQGPRRTDAQPTAPAPAAPRP